MTILREEKIAGIANDIPDVEVDSDEDAEVLVLGWGSTYASILAGVRRARAKGHPVARAHLRHMFPFPKNLGDVLARYPKILIPELNRGHLWRLVRSEFLADATRFSKVQGQPFKAAEIEAKIVEMIAG